METFRDWSCRECHVIPPYMWPLAGLEIAPKRSPTFYLCSGVNEDKNVVKKKRSLRGYGEMTNWCKQTALQASDCRPGCRAGVSPAPSLNQPPGTT